jgi:hypothetical protein
MTSYRLGLVGIAIIVLMWLQSPVSAHVVDMSACDGCSQPGPGYETYTCEVTNEAPVLLFPGTPQTAYAEVCLQNCAEGCPENGPAHDPNMTTQLSLSISSTGTVSIGATIQSKVGGGVVPAEITSTLTSSFGAATT